MAYEYILIRNIATDDTRVCKIEKGFKLKPQKDYRWFGPFKTQKLATTAFVSSDSEAMKALFE